MWQTAVPSRAGLVLLALLAASCGPGPSPPTAAAPAVSVPATSQPPANPLAAPATTTAAAPAPTSPPAPVAVRVADLQITSLAGVYLASARGYFAEQGLQVTLEPFQSGGEQIPALANGQLDIGAGGIAAGLYNAFARGVPIKLVADVVRNRPNRSAAGLAVRKDLWDDGRLRAPGDLRGRTVATAATASVGSILIERVLARGDLTMADVELVQMPFPEMAAAFANRAIDVSLYLEPFTTRAEDAGLIVRWLRADEIYPDGQNSALMFGPRLASNVDAGRRYMIAHLRGVRDYVAAFDRGEDREAVIQVLIQHTSVKDRALYDRMIPSGVNPNGYLNLRSLQDDMEWFLARGHLQQRVDLGAIVDHQFVDHALGVLGRVEE